MLDESEIYISELSKAIINVYKLCFEEMGYDLGDTNNEIEYHNYLYDNPLHMASNNDVYNSDHNIKPLSPEDLQFLQTVDIQEGGEGLEHKGRFNDKETFVKTLFNAYKAKGVNSIVASVMTAQAALESDWGRSRFAVHSNYGGINYHKGADYAIPGKSAHGHTKAGYKNVGRYVEEKIGIMNRLYPGALRSSTPEEYLRIIQGGNPNNYYYGGENEEGRAKYPNQVMGLLNSIKKYLA